MVTLARKVLNSGSALGTSPSPQSWQTLVTESYVTPKQSGCVVQWARQRSTVGWGYVSNSYKKICQWLSQCRVPLKDFVVDTAVLFLLALVHCLLILDQPNKQNKNATSSKTFLIAKQILFPNWNLTESAVHWKVPILVNFALVCDITATTNKDKETRPNPRSTPCFIFRHWSTTWIGLTTQELQSCFRSPWSTLI